MKSERRKDAYSARCQLCLKTFSLSDKGKQDVISHAKSSECSGKVGEFDHDWRVATLYLASRCGHTHTHAYRHHIDSQ